MNKITKDKELPILMEGSPVTIPNPGQFTFNPAAVNPGATRFNVSTGTADLSGVIQADQFRQRQGLAEEQLKAQLQRDKQNLAIAQGRDKQNIADGILKNYQLDSSKIVKDLGLDRSNLRDRKILEEIDGKMNAYTSRMTEATLRFKSNPNMLNSELTKIKGDLLKEINSTPGLAEQQQLNAQMIAFQAAVKGKDFSSNRAGDVVLDFVKYKNDLDPSITFDPNQLNPTDFLDTSAATGKTMVALGKGLFTTKRSIEKEGGYVFDVEKVVSPDAAKLQETKDQLFNVIKNDEDFLNLMQGQIGDITKDEDIRSFVNLEIDKYKGEVESTLGDRRSLGKDADPEKDKDGNVDYSGLSDTDIVKELGAGYIANKGYVDYITELNKLRSENPGVDINTILSDPKNRQRVLSGGGTNPKPGVNKKGERTASFNGGDNFTINNKGQVRFQGSSIGTTTKKGGKEYLAIPYDNDSGQEFLKQQGLLNADSSLIPDAFGLDGKANNNQVEAKNGIIQDPDNDRVLLPIGGTSGKGMRTDRHNNPLAITTDVAQQAKDAGANINFSVGDGFPQNEGGDKFQTAIIESDNPVDDMIEVIDAIGFYTQSGSQRWTHTALSKEEWNKLDKNGKIEIVRKMYKEEGGEKEAEFFSGASTSKPTQSKFFNAFQDSTKTNPGFNAGG